MESVRKREWRRRREKRGERWRRDKKKWRLERNAKGRITTPKLRRSESDERERERQRLWRSEESTREKLRPRVWHESEVKAQAGHEGGGKKATREECEGGEEEETRSMHDANNVPKTHMTLWRKASGHTCGRREASANVACSHKSSKADLQRRMDRGGPCSQSAADCNFRATSSGTSRPRVCRRDLGIECHVDDISSFRQKVGHRYQSAKDVFGALPAHSLRTLPLRVEELSGGYRP